MIKTISNNITKEYGKHNWIDQNGVVFGFSDYQQCCEEYGWGVYDPITRLKIVDDPNGLSYHFDLSIKPNILSSPNCSNTDGFYVRPELIDILDCVQIKLVHDFDPTNNLIFECYTNHNGYYLHDFSFKKTSLVSSRPRLFIIRGKPGSGKSTLAKKYEIIHLDEDMFAISGGRYHLNDSDGSGVNALYWFEDAVEYLLRSSCDVVISSILPFCSKSENDRSGFTLYRILSAARKYGYEIYCSTLEASYGNHQGCTTSIYDDIFIGYEDLKKQLERVFDKEFVESIHWHDMPTEVVVDNEKE